MKSLPSLDQFRRGARAWLANHVDPLRDDRAEWGVGSDSVAVFHDRTEPEEALALKSACDWHRVKLRAGWAALTWPEKYGGRGLPPIYELAFAAEEALFEVPPIPEALTITLSLVAPTVDRLGT